jgi:hypothetical protein
MARVVKNITRTEAIQLDLVSPMHSPDPAGIDCGFVPHTVGIKYKAAMLII